MDDIHADPTDDSAILAEAAVPHSYRPDSSAEVQNQRLRTTRSLSAAVSNRQEKLLAPRLPELERLVAQRAPKPQILARSL